MRVRFALADRFRAGTGHSFIPQACARAAGAREVSDAFHLFLT